VKRAVRELLERHADTFEVGRRLHAVPPHVVYECEFDGRRAVCKLSVDARGSAPVEGRVLRLVDRETRVPVPAVLAVDDVGFVAAYRDDAPDAPASDPPRLRPDWLHAAGRALGRLHEDAPFERPGLLAVDGDPADPGPGLRVDAGPGATWSDALDDLLAVYQDAVADAGYADVVADARDVLGTDADRFDVLEGRDPALLHGWFTPEHVAVEGGEVTCVVDFEHALVGSAEWDYWRTAVPLFEGDRWDRPDDAAERFRAGYESVRPLPDGLETRAEAYRAFVGVSYLDSLHAQQGIDEETRDRADALREYVTGTLRALREDWS
jgi:Ser/Thr protein kinase RdoA (MazF antagonist)